MKLLLYSLLLVLCMSVAFAEESSCCEGRPCFSQDAINCLFVKLLPFFAGFTLLVTLGYVRYGKKIAALPTSKKAIIIGSTLLLFYGASFLLVKLFFKSQCG